VGLPPPAFFAMQATHIPRMKGVALFTCSGLACRLGNRVAKKVSPDEGLPPPPDHAKAVSLRSPPVPPYGSRGHRSPSISQPREAHPRGWGPPPV